MEGGGVWGVTNAFIQVMTNVYCPGLLLILTREMFRPVYNFRVRAIHGRKTIAKYSAISPFAEYFRMNLWRVLES